MRLRLYPFRGALIPWVLVLSLWVKSSAPAPLHIQLDFTLADPKYYDSEAMNLAKDILEDVVEVSLEQSFPRFSSDHGLTDCTPDWSPRVANVGNLREGEILIFVYTEDTPQVGEPFCTYEIAFTRICVTEAETNIPVVAFVNICPVDSPTLYGAQRERQRDYNVRVWLHEFIHALGFVPYTMQHIMGQGEPDPGQEGIVATDVVLWAREQYQCDGIESVPIHGGHWDPFFVGESELMTACLAEGAVLSPFTLLFLQGLGWYRIRTERMTEHGHIIQQSMPVFEGGDNETCSFAIFNCGLEVPPSLPHHAVCSVHDLPHHAMSHPSCHANPCQSMPTPTGFTGHKANVCRNVHTGWHAQRRIRGKGLCQGSHLGKHNTNRQRRI